ncbi:MAG TPA: PepSY domain-containing protein [Planctomycetota bacterium]|nr:PepSY domain-containing protein [Planctomycetota bacterium]
MTIKATTAAVLGFGLLAAAGLARAGGGGDDAPVKAPAAKTEAAKPKAAKPCGRLELLEVLGQDLLSPADALARAAKVVADGTAVEIELTVVRVKEKRVAAWEADFVAGGKMVEVVVDARSGEVLSKETEDDPAEVKKLEALLAKGPVRMPDALAALKAAGQGLVLQVELDDEGGAAVWESGFVRGGLAGEVLLSTASGKVVADDGEDDDGEDDDDDDDDDDGDDDEDGEDD